MLPEALSSSTPSKEKKLVPVIRNISQLCSFPTDTQLVTITKYWELRSATKANYIT